MEYFSKSGVALISLALMRDSNVTYWAKKGFLLNAIYEGDLGQLRRIGFA